MDNATGPARTHTYVTQVYTHEPRDRRSRAWPTLGEAERHAEKVAKMEHISHVNIYRLTCLRRVEGDS